MTFALTATVVVSAVLFLVYGALCLFSDGMEEEFTRYGLSRFRRLTGALELVGGGGLLVGLRIPGLLVLAAGGLALLMLLGVITRIRVRDPLLETLPAAALLAANVFIAAVASGLLAR
jgi:hypothetical protein